jgi:hypothetical protein
MAIALVETVIGGLGDGGGDDFLLANWTPAANDLVLVSVARRDEDITPTCSGNNLTFAVVADIDNVQGQGGHTLFRAQGGAPVEGQIEIDVTGNGDPVSAMASRFSGCATGGTYGSEAVEASVTDTGPDPDDDDLLIVVTTITANAWAFASAWNRGGETLNDPPAAGETTIVINQIYGTAGDRTHCSTWYQGPIAVPAATQLGEAADLSGDADWCIIGVSLKPAAAGATGQPMMLRATTVPGLRPWHPRSNIS